MSKQKLINLNTLIIAIVSVASISTIGLLSFAAFKPKAVVASKTVTESNLQAKSLTIGILTNPGDYNELANYLRTQFDNKVQVAVDGSQSISYSDVRDRLIRKEWDVAFALSPMLSVAAKENGYTFAARMFADKPSYYQAALFVKSNSSIQSLNDLKPSKDSGI